MVRINKFPLMSWINKSSRTIILLKLWLKKRRKESCCDTSEKFEVLLISWVKGSKVAKIAALTTFEEKISQETEKQLKKYIFLNAPYCPFYHNFHLVRAIFLFSSNKSFSSSFPDECVILPTYLLLY